MIERLSGTSGSRKLLQSLVIPELKCQLEESYFRSTRDISCGKKEMHEGLCYDPCDAGYFSATGFACIEYCPSGYTQVGPTCTKVNTCNTCVPVCIPTFDCDEVCVPWVGCHEVCTPSGVECHDECTPYPCPDIKTANTYIRTPSIATICPRGYSSIGVVCYEDCKSGFSEILGGEISCVCDVITFGVELMSFMDDIKKAINSELNKLLNTLQPILTMDPTDLIDNYLNNYLNKLQLIAPYMDEIETFINFVQSLLAGGNNRRRLTVLSPKKGYNKGRVPPKVDDTKPKVGFEISAGIHRGDGITAAIGVTKPSEHTDFKHPTPYGGYCSGVLTDVEGGVGIAIVFYKNIDAIPGDSKVIGIGGDLFNVISGDVFVILSKDHDEFLGTGFSVGGGVGIMPVEGNYHSCNAQFM